VHHDTLLTTYDAVRLDLIIVLAFLILSKVGMVYLMTWMTGWLTERTETEKGAAKRTAIDARKQNQKYGWDAFRILWLGVAVLWVVNGILQMKPSIVLMSPQMFLHLHPTLGQAQWARAAQSWFLQMFSAHPIGINLTSAFSQIAIGLLMLFSFNRLTGKIALCIGIVFCALLWGMDNGDGYLSFRTTFFQGAPGAPLLTGILMALLLIPRHRWQQPSFRTRFRFIFASLWLLFGLWEVVAYLNDSYVWQAAQAAHAHNLSYRTGNSGPILSVVFPFLVVVACILRKRTGFILHLLLYLFLVYIWHQGQHDGSVPDYAFQLNAAPVVLLFLFGANWLSAYDARNSVRTGSQSTNQTTGRDSSA